MAVSFVARKCTQCAGKLQYIKEKKIWKCLYCGAEIERQEQYDGLFTIKNVVRQTLLDTAYRRLDSASKNLIECEKIDSHYIGTTIAKLAYDMVRVTTPGACDPRDVKSIFTKLKMTYEQLKADGTTGISDEEEALYEFFEESDIFATLVLVYDALNDEKRRDYAAQLLDAKGVFSKPANNNLLSYAVKRGKIELADQVIENVDNLDPKAALADVLSRYPDGESKGDRIMTLISTGVIQYEDRKIIENYLSESSDNVVTKSKASIAALNYGLPIGSDLLMEQVIKKADPDVVQETLTAFCKTKISDEDVIKILAFSYECGNLQTAFNAMDCLKESGQFVVVPAKLLIAMLSNDRISVENKKSLLAKSFEFKVDNKSIESVLTNYLCFNADKAEDRRILIACLLDHVSNIPTATVENYVLKCSTDGENKPAIVGLLFEKGLNASFFNDLLSKYMNGTSDDKETKKAIVEVLSQKGLRIDPGSLIDYICESPDEAQDKIQFVKKMVANGSQLRADAANAYLEKTLPGQFSSELFSLVFAAGSSFSSRAVENYLLRFKDRESIKADNAKTILEHAAYDVANSSCQIVHLGNSVTCNLLQAYTLATTDSQAVATDIVNFLSASKKFKFNSEISVSNTSMKFKKYVVSNKSNLSETTNQICEKFKVYSMLF